MIVKLQLKPTHYNYQSKKMKHWSLSILLASFIGASDISKEDANTFLSRRGRIQHDRVFETQCIEQDCSYDQFSNIVNHRNGIANLGEYRGA